MIRIDWDEVELVKTKLFRSGAADTFEMVIIIFYDTKSKCDKLPVMLGDLEEALFELSGDENIKGLFLYDIEMKQPYLKCEKLSHVNAIETVPDSGHLNVLSDFGNMTSEGRDVWLEIMMSELQHYMDQGT